MVSATSTCCTPMPFIRPGEVVHALGRISPSYGQPTVQLMAPRTRCLAANAASTTGAKRSMLSAMLQLMFFWLKASLAAPKTTISSGLSAAAMLQSP
jgi:hypothetical protein